MPVTAYVVEKLVSDQSYDYAYTLDGAFKVNEAGLPFVEI